MQKLRQRALIADDVGLGKTIEAGLILKELTARNRADRVLFVVPAHLQKKWIRDMDRFFDISPTPADRQWVEGERRRLGEETNIWDQDHQQMVTSMAFLRQEEFREELDDAFWDVVVVDEAHKAAKRGESPSKTSKMVERVADNSDSLLLLSATPHDGKGEAFRSLIEYIDPFLVAEDQDLSKEAVDRVMMRRGKQTIYDDDGERIFPNRDVGTIPVEMTHEERQFYRAVTDYVKNVYNRSEQLNEPAVGFAMALMQKRLVSSIGAIKATLSRRLANLVDQQSTTTNLSEEASAYLEGEDLDEQDQQKAEEELSGLTITESDAQLEEEIETLRDLVSLAEGIPVDSKAQKVRRYIQQLLEEQPNEKILLFTEYRDTLDYILDLVKDEPWADEILVIHGGVDKEDRTRIEDEFNHGQSRLLFATDAASEGSTSSTAATSWSTTNCRGTRTVSNSASVASTATARRKRSRCGTSRSRILVRVRSSRCSKTRSRASVGSWGTQPTSWGCSTTSTSTRSSWNPSGTTNRRVRRKKSWKNSSTNASGRSRSGTSGV